MAVELANTKIFGGGGKDPYASGPGELRQLVGIGDNVVKVSRFQQTEIKAAKA